VGVGDAAAHGQAAGSGRRRAATVSHGSGLVLLAGRGALRRGCRQRCYSVRKTLLVVHHTVSPATYALHLAIMEGAQHPSISGVEVVVRPALAAGAVDVLHADGYLLGSPVNLGYLSGALKHFFDQIYYPCLDATRRRPFGVYLHADNDATGALRALDTITAGLQWR